MVDTNKFFNEVAKRLPRDGKMELSMKEHELEVCIDPNRRFSIRESGRIAFPENSVHDDTLNESYYSAVNTIDMVKEYMAAMEQAPPLTAIDSSLFQYDKYGKKIMTSSFQKTAE